MVDDDCDCEPDAGDEVDLFLYTQTCECGQVRETTHCPHDGCQNPCPNCGWMPPGARSAVQILFGA